MNGYIYIIKNTINNKVYVGQTSCTIEARWNQHKAAALRGKTQGIILYNAMRKYGVENFYISILEEIPCEKLNEREIYWIQYYDCQTPNGYNVRSGGEDSGRKEVYKIDPNTNEILECYGSATAAAEANNIDLSLLTKVCRGETERNSCGNYKWCYVMDYDKEKITKINVRLINYGVCQIDSKTGNLIKEWPSIAEASKETKIQQSDISHCLSGKYRTAGGFNWCRKEDLEKFKPKTQFKQVIQKDKQGNIIKVWADANEAAKELGKVASSIRAAARGVRKTAYGFIWEYKGED